MVHEGEGSRPAQVLEGPETVLVVEDTGQVRELVRNFLETSGYRVLTAQDSVEAARMAHEYAGVIDLVLSDVVLPGVSGPAFVERLLSERPEIKVLFMSGYTEDKLEPHKLSGQNFGFIEKPFTRAGLASKVREVLDGASGSPRASRAG
jgi:two-component system, cell cycle sensor histidine kinase and response regulator CckA